MSMSDGDQFFNRGDCTENVRNVSHGDKLGSLRKESFVVVELELTRGIARNHLDHGTRFFGNELPRNDVGVVFQDGNDDFVARLERGLHVSVCNQVNGFGRTADENDFLCRRSADKVTDNAACVLVSIRRSGGKRVRTTVDVRVFVFVVVLEAVNDLLRPLRCCSVIEPNQRMTVDLLRKNREVGTDLGKCLGTDADRFVSGICARICRVALSGIATERSRSVHLAVLLSGLSLGNDFRRVSVSRGLRYRNIALLRQKLRFRCCRGFNSVEPCVCSVSAVSKRCRGHRLIAVGRKRMFPVKGWRLVDGCGTLGGTYALCCRSILCFGSSGGCISAIRQIREIRVCQLLQFSRIGNSGEFFQRSGFWIIRSHSIRQPLRLQGLRLRRRKGLLQSSREKGGKKRHPCCRYRGNARRDRESVRS